MKNQADNLRQIVQHMKKELQLQFEGNTKKTRIITITSGKGGVGKSNLAVNLAIALAEYKKKTILLDADLGLANIDVILGISPQDNLASVIFGEKNISEIICNGPRGIRIIPGGSGMHELANLKEWQLERFMTKLSHLEGTADYLIIDTGAGLSNTVLSFALSAEEIIVVATPEPTSLTDAYGLIKTTREERYQGKIYVIVNRVLSPAEAQTAFSKLQTAVRRFLDYKIYYIGYVREDCKVIQAVQAQQPFVISHPLCSAAQDIKAIAAIIESQEYHPQTTGGMKEFFGKVSDCFR